MADANKARETEALSNCATEAARASVRRALDRQGTAYRAKPDTATWTRYGFEKQQIVRLNHICATSKYGLCFHLVTHQGAQAVLAPWDWTDDEVAKFRQSRDPLQDLPCDLFNIDPNAPLLYINFASMKADQIGYAERPGNDGHHYQSILHAIHSDETSFYIFIDEDYNRLFLVPSRVMEVVVETTSTEGRTASFSVKLNNGKAIHDYECLSIDIVATLKGVLTAAQDPTRNVVGKWQTKDEVYSLYAVDPEEVEKEPAWMKLLG